MIAGIDVSTKSVDVVLLADDGPSATWAHWSIADPRGPFFAAQKAAHELPGASTEFWDDVWLIGIEKPYSQNRGTVRALALITGAVAARLPRGVTVIETAPAEWKRETCGVANATKDTVRAWALSQGFGWNGETQDACDALAIAWAARALNEQAVNAA